ncbi:MAG: DUF370 domain-containing protein [Christensenella sp.]|uniref:extracellular matrix regulator RemB n=1 Tax=Christensenella sp. TaxID=1935934 RepID=UPI002B21C0FA|nr:DUF370 domain-containing protein [Christensenella sp.]MEA5003344.1 DUF370 domain-containing protein [Christensenella sp.]
MILHLGSDYFAKTKNIVMILDYEEAVSNEDTSLFLKGIECVKITEEDPKSIIITQEKDERRGFLSPISARTLLKRSKKFELNDENRVLR